MKTVWTISLAALATCIALLAALWILRPTTPDCALEECLVRLRATTEACEEFESVACSGLAEELCLWEHDDQHAPLEGWVP